VIARWLGHESTETTQIYLHADMSISTAPSSSPPGRYTAPDTLLAFFETL
jgi:integrase/recombinase XerD